MLTNANFENTVLKFIPSQLVEGIYSDFHTRWYMETGNLIVQTMLIFAVFPYLNFFIYYILSYLFRALDSGPLYFLKKGKDRKTKMASVQAFVDTYAGPEFDLYYRYPQLINTVWVIFTYGVALPILYPVGLVCMVNTYICERI